MAFDTERRRRSVRALWVGGRIESALDEGWAALDAAPGDVATKVVLARILARHPTMARFDRERGLHRLVNDRDIDPGAIAPAGWALLLRGGNFFRAARDPASMAQRLEAGAFARDMLKAAYVASIDVELPLTGLRRWLLLSGGWKDFPLSLEALVAQAALNCGAWPFDDEERALIETGGQSEIARAYLPRRPVAGDGGGFGHAVTRAVAGQYEGWPYPVWTRAMAPEPASLPATIKSFDPDGPDTIPIAADVLIAGCGTGHEATMIARQHPEARIVAIDLSRASLDYARMRCAEAGLRNIEFRVLDLHQVAELDRRFDVIAASGVLHHLCDPEKGWAALASVLKPGGAMKVMVYSRLARQDVRDARQAIADLVARPVSDDLLREVRRRLIETRRFPKSRDFFTLPGVHDLLLHAHEDAFDLPRIERALNSLGLELLTFCLPSPRNEALYKAENPADPFRRSFEGWAVLERRHPRLFAGMYEFWCRKPVIR